MHRIHAWRGCSVRSPMESVPSKLGTYQEQISGTAHPHHAWMRCAITGEEPTKQARHLPEAGVGRSTPCVDAAHNACCFAQATVVSIARCIPESAVNTQSSSLALSSPTRLWTSV